MKSGHRQLDLIDRQLLSALQHDAKLSLGKLGERVGLSAPSVMDRVRKLEQAGVITGYHARLDARRVGMDITAFIGVDLHQLRLEGFVAWARGEDRIQECHHVTGAYTLLLKVRAEDTEALQELLSRIRTTEGVGRTETMVVLSTHAERMTMPLGLAPDAAPTAPKKRARGARNTNAAIAPVEE